MKQLKFETSKGSFLLIDLPNIEEIEKELQIFGHDQRLTNDDLNSYFRHFLPDFNKSYELSEITEEQASQIINNFDKIPNDVPNNIDYCKLSLKSLLKSKGIHLFENPYNVGTSKADYNKYKEAESKTFYNPYIFKL